MVAVPTHSNTGDDEALAAHASALLSAIERAVGGWAQRCVVERWSQWSGKQGEDEVLAAARSAGERVRDEVVAELRDLLGQDPEQQHTNPLAVIRRAGRHVTEALRSIGVPPVVRDAHAERIHPTDDYDIAPASFADIDPSLHEPGIVWGAAKAHVILHRRRS